jgi:hypothetical protein
MKAAFIVILFLSQILLGQIQVVIAQSICTNFVYPLKISANQRILVDQNNTPFLINGEAAWSLMVELTKSEVDEYFENRRQKGFNTIIVNLIEHFFGGPVNAYGDAPFLIPGDFSTPNESYFAHADWVIGKAAEYGIVAVVAPAYLGWECADEGWCQEVIANGADKCQNYGRYLGNRYKDFANIIWLNGCDTEANEAYDEVNAIVEGIKEFDTVHLHAAQCIREKSALDCYDEAWLDINSTYSSCSLAAFRSFVDYNRQRLMPFFFIEGTYENEGGSPACLRSQAYRSILGGATGHFFGNNPIWYFGDGNRSYAGFPFVRGLSWREALESGGSLSMKHMNNLFNSRPWHRLIPDYDHELVVAGYRDINNDSYVAAARTSDSLTAIIYLPQRKTITIDLTELSGEQIKAWWFNPSTGIATFLSTYYSKGLVDFTPPTEQDWILVLDDEALDLPPPGSIDNPASVKLLNFSARVDGNSVSLDWTINTEADNFGFEIQRSVDGKVFVTIGFIDKSDDLSKVKKCTFLDKDLQAGQYSYRLKQVDEDGGFIISQVIQVDIVIHFELKQNFPNPFNATTTITYSLPIAGPVQLSLFNIGGKEVAKLIDEFQSAGTHSCSFDSSKFPSGLYFYVLLAHNCKKARKMLLLK